MVVDVIDVEVCVVVDVSLTVVDDTVYVDVVVVSLTVVLD